MPNSLAGVLANIPGIGGYEAARQQNTQIGLGQVQQIGVLQEILSKQLAMQREQAFRNEIAQARTPEEQMATAAKYGGPEGILKHVDRQTQIKAIHEAVMARLTQAASQFEANWQLRYKNATTQEERLTLERQREQFKQGLQSEAARLAGAKAAYDFGFMPTIPPASNITSAEPIAGTSNPADFKFRTPSGTISGRASSEQEAMDIGRAVLGTQSGNTSAPQIVPAPQPIPMPAPQPTPQPASSAPAIPAATVAQAIPPMPPEIARLPLKGQQAWLLQQTKAMASAPTGQGTDAIVKAIIEGRMQMPSGFALRSPYWQDIIAKVAQQDPNFDASKYGARAAARRTFASGPEARNVTALNTVIGHLGTLDEMAAALQNKDLRAYNAISNRFVQELGDPRVNNFDVARQAVAEETMRVFRQVNASEQEVMHWKAVLTSASSPQQLRGSIATLGKLLDSRVEAIAQQYERTLSGSNPARVDPANRARLDQLIKQGSSRYIETRRTADGRLLGKNADGTIEEIK